MLPRKLSGTFMKLMASEVRCTINAVDLYVKKKKKKALNSQAMIGEVSNRNTPTSVGNETSRQANAEGLMTNG